MDDPPALRSEEMQWKKAPIEGMSGKINNDHALISFFFFFFFFPITYGFFSGNLPTIRLNDRERSPPRYAGHDCNDCAILSFFFLFFKYLLGFYRKTAHDQAHNDRERTPQRYREVSDEDNEPK